MIKTYTTIPTQIEAVQWTGFNKDEIIDFCGNEIPNFIERQDGSYSLYIITLEGIMEASLTDYIIKGVLGEFYPCKETAFIRKYKEVIS